MLLVAVACGGPFVPVLRAGGPVLHALGRMDALRAKGGSAAEEEDEGDAAAARMHRVGGESVVGQGSRDRIKVLGNKKRNKII